jgi:hypothetical protein
MCTRLTCLRVLNKAQLHAAKNPDVLAGAGAVATDARRVATGAAALAARDVLGLGDVVGVDRDVAACKLLQLSLRRRMPAMRSSLYLTQSGDDDDDVPRDSSSSPGASPRSPITNADLEKLDLITDASTAEYLPEEAAALSLACKILVSVLSSKDEQDAM